MLGTPGDDSLRQRGANARQACDLAHVGAIDVDFLTRQERTGELRGATRGLAQAGTGGRSRGLELDVARGCSGRRGQDETNAGTGQCEGGEEESGATIVHPPTYNPTPYNQSP